MHNTKLHSE